MHTAISLNSLPNGRLGADGGGRVAHTLKITSNLISHAQNNYKAKSNNLDPLVRCPMGPIVMMVNLANGSQPAKRPVRDTIF